MFLNIFTLLFFLFIGGLFVKCPSVYPVYIDPNNLMSFASSDMFGIALILFILVSTIVCMIAGRKD